MAFIRIGGEVKKLRSGYDGHVDSFGLGCAKSIAAMPAEALASAARAFDDHGDGEDAPSAKRLSPSESMSLYAELCGSALGPSARAECIGLGQGQTDFGIPYIGLGPVLLSGSGPDVSDWGYDYAYLVDVDNEQFGLIKNEELGKIELAWQIPFATLRSVKAEAAMEKAFAVLSEIDEDESTGASAKIQAKVDAALKKAAKAKPDAAVDFFSDEASWRSKIAALAMPSFAEASASGTGASGVNFEFARPIHALLVQGVLQLAGQKDLVARQMHLDSGFGVAEDGTGGGQLLSRSRMDKKADEWAHALSDGFREALKSVGREASSFAGSGGRSYFGDEEQEKVPALKDWSDSCMDKKDVLEQLAQAGADQVALRWDFFDFNLATALRREDWLAQISISLASPDLPMENALGYAAWAMGTADAQLLDMVGSSIHVKTIMDADAGLKARLAGNAAIGARLMAALSPVAALDFVDAFNAGPFGALVALSGSTDRMWLENPATCIAGKAGALLEYIHVQTPIKGWMSKGAGRG